MKRGLLALPVLIAIVVVLVASSGGRSNYRFAAIFDTAKGMVPGQLVKIAGARVGTVEKLTVVPGPNARIEMSISPQYGPFHSNATCQIQPEGPISEYFINCNPGFGAPERIVGGLPTVPVTHTGDPVTLQDVINIFSLPVDQRIGVLINELGIATAGRGQDINGILSRANPALGQAQRVLGIISSQARQLEDAVGQTDTVLTQLAAGHAQLRTFVDRVASVARTTAGHSQQLAAAIHDMPPLLHALRGGLAPLNKVMVNLTPLLGDLRSAGPELTRLDAVVPEFISAGTPALRALAPAASAGLAAIPHLRPVVARLRTLAEQAGPTVALLDQLLVSTRDTGGIEGLLRLVYVMATVTSSYDGISHMADLILQLDPQCWIDPSSAGCSHSYGAPGHGTVPVNDPAAGPEPSDWQPTAPLFTDPAASATAARSAPATAATPTNPLPRIGRAELRQLLTYLLK